MQIRRFFSQAISFESQSTAIKILYRIKDLAQMNETDRIYLQGQLIQELSNALSHVLKYGEYQKLSLQNKDEIKLLIATELHEQSKKYSYNPVIFVDNYPNKYSLEPKQYERSDENMKDKGIGYNYNYIYSYGGELLYRETIAKEVNFPKDFFLNQKKLRKHVASALKESYRHVLSHVGLYYVDLPQCIQVVNASTHPLFGNGSSTKPLIEIITQYLDDDPELRVMPELVTIQHSIDKAY